MEHVKTRGAAMAIVVFFACMMLLTACSGATNSGQSNTDADSAAQGHATMVMGDQSSATKAIVLSNKIGDISKVAVNVSGSKDEPTLLMTGETWSKGTQALIFIPTANSEARSDFVLTVGDKDYVLHEVDFTNIQTGDVCLKDEIAYIQYAMGGKMMSTLEHENDLISREKAVKKAQKAKEEAEKKAKEEAEKKKAEEEAAARAEAEAAAAAQAQAEAEAAAAQAWTEAPAEDYYYQEPAYDQQYVEQPYVEQPVEQQYVEQPVEQQYTE